ncbi:TatD family nuclease-associated radical SAM protein [Litoribrevibacter euphylliae]|uniref:TatD family nuclease-associated radical SAM protein n=1 Tax=Litoribrevibacter euphylliae TaxID=1834034 RepID=A0ABV7HES4_9GAMM
MALTLVYDIGNKRYINLTNACTLECQFCPKHNGSTQVHEFDLHIKKQPSTSDIIIELGDLSKVEEVVFCGFGESTLRLLPLLEIAAYVKAQGVPVRVNTDGLGNLVHQRNILPDLASVVDALSISLNAQNEAVYNRHCHPKKPGAYQAVRDFIELAPKYIQKVEVSAIDGLEDVDVVECQRIAEASGAKFKRRVLDVVG